MKSAALCVGSSGPKGPAGGPAAALKGAALVDVVHLVGLVPLDRVEELLDVEVVLPSVSVGTRYLRHADSEYPSVDGSLLLDEQVDGVVVLQVLGGVPRLAQEDGEEVNLGGNQVRKGHISTRSSHPNVAAVWALVGDREVQLAHHLLGGFVENHEVESAASGSAGAVVDVLAALELARPRAQHAQEQQADSDHHLVFW
eukprot:CAMPEP_0173212534 /NCGR_PEP_ID=MMETSP1141-20130122/24854_1 /TAXON_ID=483371 /ORGANISM="non described non described, Strain CCMP2298" /LENGTH=198 /DNA_ID=CAMNT_0014139565 /DNA_START=243 /DNA_END=838 /DNA_ORIENTATION=+